MTSRFASPAPRSRAISTASCTCTTRGRNPSRERSVSGRRRTATCISTNSPQYPASEGAETLATWRQPSRNPVSLYAPMTATVIAAGSALTSAKVRAQNYKQVGALVPARTNLSASSRMGRYGNFASSRSLFFPAILHADDVLIVACVSRVIFHTRQLIFPALFTIIRLLSPRCGENARGNCQS